LYNHLPLGILFSSMSQAPDTYWQEEVHLFDGVFPYFRHQNKPRSVSVRAKIHSSQERYFDIDAEIVPIATLKGERSYINMHPFVEEPNIVLTISMPPNGYADTPAIGSVQAAKVQSFRDIQIGNVQAWYYPSEAILILWECYLFSSFTSSASPHTATMRDLWRSVEKYLRAQFPQIERIATPFSDPLYPTEEYQAFLRTLGYEPVAKAAYGKLV
jgi:hypothetical protein